MAPLGELYQMAHRQQRGPRPESIRPRRQPRGDLETIT
jgi:hypothetical protein